MKFADVTKDSSSSTTTHLACSEALFDGSVASARADHRRFRGFGLPGQSFSADDLAKERISSLSVRSSSLGA